MNYVSRTTTIWTMCKFSIPLLNCVVYQKCVFTIYSHKNWSKTNKNDQKSTKKGSVHYLKISLKTWKIKKRWSLNCSFDTTQKETGVPLFDKTVRDFPSKNMFFHVFSWFCHFWTTFNFINIPWMDLFVGVYGTAWAYLQPYQVWRKKMSNFFLHVAMCTIFVG